MGKKLIKNKKKKLYKYRTKKFVSRIITRIEIYNYCIIFIKIIFLLFTTNIIFNKNYHITLKNKFKDQYFNIASDKWIVMTVVNPPSNMIIDLEKQIENWKIVVIGNSNTIDSNWDIFINSTKLIYLSIKDQNNLGYNIIKYLNDDSYCRKNIGYLFAIQHGAKEIYEFDENLNISENNFSFLDFNINDSYICYGIQDNKKMINPYVFFSETNIWPRGFLYTDIMNDYNKTFRYTHFSKVKLTPLVYQGLINEFPDVDSIFHLTNANINFGHLNIKFSNNHPLLYLPGNYVPINSKNTKYSYDIFPFLMLPITINESISDILRGYIIERFVYEYNGTIVYHNTNVYNKYKFINNTNFFGEKEIFFNLNEIISIIKLNECSKDNSKNLLFSILSELIKKNILKNKELQVYQAFLEDLSNFGYVFSKKIENNLNHTYKNYLNISSEFIYYLPTNPNILRRNENTYKIMKHSSSDKVYNDILLIINYNNPGFLKLNKYLEELYKKSFPNIIYLYPGKTVKNESNIITCKESNMGYFSYRCLEYIYEKYPNYKGYLLTNDDDYLKVWELENLDFSIPWFYIYEQRGFDKTWVFYSLCKGLYNIIDNNLDWKQKIINFYGFYKLFNGFSDLYYLPNNIVSSFIEFVKIMYNSKIFLECAVPASFALTSAPKNQIIHIRALWTTDRTKVLEILHEEYEQISIHPIKFSNGTLKKGVLKYNYFTNAKYF